MMDHQVSLSRCCNTTIVCLRIPVQPLLGCGPSMHVMTLRGPVPHFKEISLQQAPRQFPVKRTPSSCQVQRCQNRQVLSSSNTLLTPSKLRVPAPPKTDIPI